MNFNFLRKATSSLELLDQFPSYINWSSKGKRVSFNWILFFNGLAYSTTNLTRSLFLEKTSKATFSPILSQKNDLHFPYERRETKKQQQKIQKIDLFFNKLVYSNTMETLGFPWDSRYVMSFNPFRFSLFFREDRPLWNPQTMMPSYSILFFDRDLVINQKFLTKLYITYGNKFQAEKLNRKRIKKQIFWSNSSILKEDFNKISERTSDSEKNFFKANGPYSLDFSFYQNLINLNAQLDQAHIQLPIYLHQGWITADPHETYRLFDLLSSTILVNNYSLIEKESLLFEILLEIYHYLIKLFIQNKDLMNQINHLLIKKRILCRKDIEEIIKKSC